MSMMNDFTRRVRLWILNDEVLYKMAKGCRTPADFKEQMLDMEEAVGNLSAVGKEIFYTAMDMVDWQYIWEEVNNEE